MEEESFIKETKCALKNAKARFLADLMRVPEEEGNN
jgi:hypothetical protein